MPFCHPNTCSHARNDDAFRRPAGQALKVGDISTVLASVTQPFKEMLAGTGGISVLSARSAHAAESLASAPWDLKRRPCLIMTLDKTGVQPPKLCLLASFNQGDIASLPAVVQRFLIPIITKPEESKGRHLHTTPDWNGKSPQWIIAQPYPARNRELTERFETRPSDRMPNGSQYCLDGPTMRRYAVWCRQIQAEWLDQIKPVKKADAKAILVSRTPS